MGRNGVCRRLLSSLAVRAPRQQGVRQGVFTGFVGIVCATVTIGGSIAGISGTGDKYAAERAKIVASANDDRAELVRITREREAMTFAPTTGEVVMAAREAVASAERLRIAECGAENERRGPSCRKRETDEQARREALSVATANKATTDRAAALDAGTATIRARIDGAKAVQISNPGAAAISRLLRIEADDAVSLSALLGALALELAGMAAMMRADAHRPVDEAKPGAPSEQLAEPEAVEPATTLMPPRTSTAAIVEPATDTVGRFMLACLTSAKGEEVAGAAIYARHRRWCDEQQPPLASLDARAFAREFAARCERLSIRTRREGAKVYCLDVRLAAR
jgi:hypothetical protein